MSPSDPPDRAPSRPPARGSGGAAGRPPARRRTREELRALVLEAGVELAREEGLGTGTDHLSFKRVFERLEGTTGIHVTNASVIGRVWPSIDQYRRDVLMAAGAADTVDALPAVIEQLARVLDGLDLSTPEARDAALAEACRVGGAVTLDQVVTSPAWRTQVGVWVLAFTGPDSGPLAPVRGAIAEGYAHVLARSMVAYQGLAVVLGFRLRPPGTVEEFSVSTNALVEGCAFQASADPDAAGEVLLPTGPDGELRPWTYFALGLHALARTYFEPDPAWVPGGGGTGEAP